jgi:hypothetical protein
MSALTVYGHKTVTTVAHLGYENCKLADEMFSNPERHPYGSHQGISSKLDLSLSDTLDAIEAGKKLNEVYRGVINNRGHGMTMIDFNDVLKAYCAMKAFQS